ncbi:DUF3619 family protein [Melaminivora sp.]|uniref:DUF3619 family protein n=1 Tax=Melaminivora sp. TaxID=1933032 RepID=UPI0028ACE4DD|nr:DUF3619 family protein [Melaminivora sp.]
MTPAEPTRDASLAMDAYARRLAARLNETGDDLPHDITERLRAARMQALERRRRPQAQAVLQPVSSLSLLYAGAAASGSGGDGRGGWWRALASAVPLTALLAGLVFINLSHEQVLGSDGSDVDAALLADDLPPSAYADPGFVQYLRSPGQNH